MTKLGQFCEQLIESGWLLSLGLIPLYINFFGIRGYSVGKAYLLRMIVVLMAAAWLMKLWEERSVRDAFGGEPQGRTLARVVNSPLALPIVAYVLVLILSTALSVAPGLSFHGSFDRFEGTSTTLTYVALFYLTALYLRTHEQFTRIITVLLLASIPIALYALAQKWIGDPFSYTGSRADLKWPARSTMGNHIFLGAYLVMLIPWTAARLVQATVEWRRQIGAPSWSAPSLIFGAGGITIMILTLAGFLILSSSIPSLRWITLPVIICYLISILWTTFPDAKAVPPLAFVIGYGCLILLQVTALALTEARGPWLGGLAGAGIFAFLIARKKSWRILTGVSVCGAAVLLFVVLLNIPKGPLEPLKRHALLNRLGSLSNIEQGSIKYRLHLWKSIGGLLWSRPEVGLPALSNLRPAFGYGPETFGLIIERVLPARFDRAGRWRTAHDRAHNDLLDHLVERGFFGLGTILWLCASFYWMTLRALWRSQDQARNLSLAALIASLSAHLIELQFGLGITSTRMFFWLSLALSLFLSQAPAVVKIQEREKASGKRRWMLFYLLLVFSLALVLATTVEITSIESGILLGFGGLLFGMILIALELGPLSATGPFHRAKLYWHALIVGLAAILIFLGALRPLIADSYHGFGAAEAQKNDLAASIFAYQRAATWDPLEEKYHMALGLTLTNLGMMLLERRPESNPPAGFSPSTAMATSLPPDEMIQLGGEGVLALAEASLMEASRLQPLDPLGRFELAQLNHEWGLKIRPERLETALVYYSEAHQMSPNRISILVSWAMLYLAKNDPVHAIEKIQAAEALGADPRLVDKALENIKQHKFSP